VRWRIRAFLIGSIRFFVGVLHGGLKLDTRRTVDVAAPRALQSVFGGSRHRCGDGECRDLGLEQVFPGVRKFSEVARG